MLRMGTSNWQNISYCVDLIRKINPQKVLDVGVGFGRWGMVCREFLDVWNGRVDISTWKTEIIGIEVFSKNINSYHDYFYNEIINENAHKFLKETGDSFDLIILGDVLEHFQKDEAYEVLEESLKKSNFVLLNIPLGKYWKQGELYGNIYEKHLSFWKDIEFSKFNVVAKKKFRDEIYRRFGVYLLTKNSKTLIEDGKLVKIKILLNQYPKLKDYIKKILR